MSVLGEIRNRAAKLNKTIAREVMIIVDSAIANKEE